MEKLSGLPVPQVRYFDTTGSTNAEALDWAASGAEDGCLVIADQQTQGRGRLGRRWITQPGSALAFSLILRPGKEEAQHLGLFTALGALAVSQALEDSLRLRSAIKWPNDVLLQGRKCAGILAEADWSGERLDGVVIGIGINIGASAVPPAEALLYPATSVEEAAGQEVDRLEMLRAVIEALFAWRKQMGNPSFLEAWQLRLAFLGVWVQIQESAEGSKRIIGQISGLAADGSLLLRDEAGQTLTISTGDVHLRPV